MASQLLLIVLIWALPSTSWAGPGATAGSGAAPSLADALNPDGTLRPGARGAFSAVGFRLSTAPDGRPAFLPLRTTGANDDRWQDGFTVRGVNGTVNAVALSGTDVYVGGLFTTAGSVVATNVAKWNGSAWSSLGTGTANGTNGVVRALAVSGTDLYVGGDFTQAGGATANRVAKWDGTNWSSLTAGGGNGISTANGTVRALAVSGSSVYVGGFFATAGATAVNNLARWDATNSTWNIAGTATNNGVNSTVFALAVNGNDVYVGGAFTLTGSTTLNRVARLSNGTTWASLGTGTSNGVGGTVNALAVIGTDVYVGGNFSTAGTLTSVNRLARWSSSAGWNYVGASAANGVGGVVYVLAVSGTTLYVGGQFTTVAGTTVAANNVARWSTGASTWSPLGTGTSNGVNSDVNALAATSTEVYVGGIFTTAGTEAAARVARLGSAWSSLGTGNGVANVLSTAINVVAVSGADVYVGGQFTTAGAEAANNVAKWNGTSWSRLGTAAANGVGGIVYALAVNGNDVYVGGNFSTAGAVFVGGSYITTGAVAATNVAKWDGSAWSSLGTGTSNGVNNIVRALAVIGPNVYVGGDFTQAGGATYNRIARWDGTSWNRLGPSNTSNGVNGTVRALAVAGSVLYVGGDFTSANSGFSAVIANRVAKWSSDDNVWSALTFLSNNGVGGAVRALAVSGSDLYVGGDFTTIGTALGAPSANRVAKWDGTTWSRLGTSTSNGVSGPVYALAVSGTDVYVGGQFTTAGTVSVSNVAKWNGSAWSSLGTGLNNGAGLLVAALGVGFDKKVYAGGAFGTVGDASKVVNSFGYYDEALLAPRITSFTPAAGAEGSTVVLTGTNFAGTTQVLFGLINAPVFAVTSATTISVTVPAGVSAGPLSVTTSAGTATSLGYFEPPMPCTATLAVTPAGPVTVSAGGSVQLTATATSPGFAQTGYGIYGDVSKLLLQADGKVLVGGSFVDYNGQGQGRLTRLLPNGTRDVSFGGGPNSGFDFNTYVYGLAQLADGKILAGGSFTTYNGTSRPYVARLNADGTLDASFATTGTGLNDEVSALVRQPDGKILVGGRFTSYNGTARPYVARLNADGSLDASFAPTGTGLNFWVNTLALQPDGKILVGGSFTEYSGASARFLVRLNADGSRDASFGQAGTGLTTTVYALALQPDGKILVGGNFGQYNGVSRGYLARFYPDGSLDGTFMATGTGFDQGVYALTLQRDGNVLVGGFFSAFNGSSKPNMARLTSTGTLDNSFALTGTGFGDVVADIVEQPDGLLLVGGPYETYNGINQRAVARLNRDGSLQNTAVPLTAVPYTWSPTGTGGNTLTVTESGTYSAYYGSCATASNAVEVTVSSVLPVTLIDFAASAAGPRAVRLAWSTAQELNSARFEVERSLDGVAFAQVGTVAAAGHSSSARSYGLLDANLPAHAATLYYRLRQVDHDGTFRYSPVRTVALSAGTTGLALYPNPTRGAVTLTGAQPGSPVQVLDALGRPVATATADASGTARLPLPAALPAGVYQVRSGAHTLRLLRD